MSMRVVHIYKDYAPVVGGIENHVRLVAEAQAAAGDDVTVLVANTGPQTTEEYRGGVHVLKAGRLATVASTPLSLSLPLELAGLEADVAHVHFPYPVGELAQYLLGRSRATVVTYHSDVVRQKRLLALYRPLMLRALNKADRIIVGSPNYLESSPVLRALADKCRVVPYGIDGRRFAAPDADRVRQLRARFATAGPLILFVGVLRYYKGLDYLLRAMPEVAGTLLVVGEGPMGEAWRALARELSLQERVVFCGRVPDEDLPTYYGAADLFVLPASERSEAYGLVQLEAMHAGLPVVSTELGTGTGFVNQHGETGLVVPARDAEALAKAIRILCRDGSLRRAFGARARARAAELSVERMVAGIHTVYREALRRAASHRG
jgi:glycosyltransferase involved in cell wall biosynthesis